MRDANLNQLMRLLILKELKPLVPLMKRNWVLGKKIKGRKRHIVTETMGNLLAVIVHKANLHDTVGVFFPAMFAHELYPTIQGYCADSGYRGTFVVEIQDILQLPVDVVSRNPGESWKILPKRWMVERTFA